MKAVNIILTLDYEIFGNGGGDPRWCMIEPTRALLDIAGRYRVPVTLMLEMCEYWAFKSQQERGALPPDYTPALWMEEQAVAAVQAGHDVQLHLHPQWLNAAYDPGTQSWKLDLSRWRISSLPYAELVEVLRRGKHTLEGWLKPHAPNYSCYAFRAGAFCLQPEAQVLKALRAAGFTLDSSAAPGCHFHAGLTRYDFRHLPRKAAWLVQDSLSREADSGIMELPIYTRRYSTPERVAYSLKRKAAGLHLAPPRCCGGFSAEPPGAWLRKFWPAYLRLDFCLMSATELLHAVHEAARAQDRRPSPWDTLPVVAIGHSKSFGRPGNFEAFVAQALKQGYSFSTFAPYKQTHDLHNQENPGT